MTHLKIDFISDVSCPWCIIGLNALENALSRLEGEVSAELHFQPFELNPQMQPGGQDIAEHLAEKYGASAEQSARNREAIRARGLEHGFVFNMNQRTRIYNTFDAHRLLHWAHEHGKQRELKHALFTAYFTEGRDPGDHGVLAEKAAQVGLDPQAAREVLASRRYADEVRAAENFFQQQGIHSVPAVVINDRHLISGGQPADVFVQALRQVAQMEQA